MESIKKDEAIENILIGKAYSDLLLGKGDKTPVDKDSMELPDWADEKKIKMGQEMFFLNSNAMIHALFVGLIASASSSTLLDILMFTGRSSTEVKAYRRYKANILHGLIWYRNPIKPGTRAWQSLEKVRNMHVAISEHTKTAGRGIISQKDMAITLFIFMGFHILNPKQFGIVGSSEQFEAFNHLWRVLGYLFGIKDEFNCCGTTLDETMGRLEAMREYIFKPRLQFPCQDYGSYTRTAVNGMWYFDPSLHYDSMIWVMKKTLKVPGFFETESSEYKQNYAKLSHYTKFRIVLDAIVYERLSHFSVFRCFFNFTRMSFSRLDEFFPFLPLMKFGKTDAYVEIMKSNT